MELLRKFKIIILLTLLIITNSITMSLASNSETTDIYKNWETLSEEEKSSYIQPMPYSTDIKSGIKNSNIDAYLKLGETLEEKYDLRDYITINVKNQETTWSCWAFSTTSALETNLAKTKNILLMFSPRHMEYATSKTFLDGVNSKGFNREVDSGGNPYIALAYYTSGNGPVLESKMPFTTDTDKINLAEINIAAEKKINEYTKFPTISKEYDANGYVSSYTNGVSGNGKVTYTEEQVIAARNKIKEHIKKYGGITAVTVAGSELNNFSQSVDTDSDGKTDQIAYYCNDSSKSIDHQITIIGWDDNFSKNYFKTPAKNDGAYLVLTSFGDSFGNKGCYYISYDDYFIESQFNFGIVETEDIDYDNIYQYDPLGYSYSWQVLNSQTKETVTSTYAANVFNTNKKDGYDEYLNEVSVYVSDTSNIEIYVNSSSDDKSKIELVASPGVLETGYHTVKLSSPIKLTGDKFVVSARYSADAVEVPLELNYSSNTDGKTSNYWDTATSESGQSFVALSLNLWTDVVDLFKDSNVCVKAFTTYQETAKEINVESVSLDQTKLEMTVGDSKSLVATINPTNVTNKNVTWTSSDKTVATIENGVIKALKTGTTTITVTTEDGNKTASCKVTVNAKTSNVDDEYNKEDNTDQDAEVSKDNSINNNDNTTTNNKNEEKDTTTNTVANTTTNKTSATTNTVNDNTTAKTILPYTGTQIIIVTLIILFIGATAIVFIKYKSFRDVK